MSLNWIKGEINIVLNEISIEILRKCTNNCLHCSSCSGMSSSEIITYEQFEKVINSALDLGLKTVCFSGGEPFLHPDIIKMIKFVSEKGLESYVYTSGVVLDEYNNRTSISEKVLEQISTSVTKLIFNIEAANPTTYNRIMGTTQSFEILKQSVINTVNQNIIAEAHFVPMKVNVDEIEDVIKLCVELNISKLSFLRLVLHGRALKNARELELNDAELRELRDKLNKVEKNRSLDIRIGVPLAGENSLCKCEAAKGKLNIKYDGAVYPCEVFKDNIISINGFLPDNIYIDEISNIYSMSDYLREARRYADELHSSDKCENCIGQYLLNKR